MDWRILKEQRVAKQAEEYANSIGGDYGASGDFGETNYTPPSANSIMDEPVDLRPEAVGVGSVRPTTAAVPSGITYPPPPKTMTETDQAEPGRRAENMRQIMDDPRSAFLYGAGSGVLPALSHVGDTLAATPPGMGILYGANKLLGGNDEFMGSESGLVKTALKPFSNVGKGAAELFGYKTDGGIDEGGTLQGQQAEKLGENVQAAMDPQASFGERAASGLIGAARGAALFSAGPRSMMTIPGTNVAPIHDLASGIMSAGSKVARAAEGAGIANPTLRELFAVAREVQPGESLFSAAARRGAINMPGKPQLTPDLSDRINRLAYQAADGDMDNLGVAWASAAERSREVASMDDKGVLSLMRDALKGEAKFENRRGISIEKPEQIAAPSYSRETDEGLGLSDAARDEILGEPLPEPTPEGTTHAPRDDTPEQYAARLDRVEKGIRSGGDPETILADASRLKREDVFDLALEMGGNANRNKQKGLQIIRDALEQKAKEPKLNVTTPEGRQEAKELQAAAEAEKMASEPQKAPVDPAKVFADVNGLDEAGYQSGGDLALKNAGLSREEYGAWKHTQDTRPSAEVLSPLEQDASLQGQTPRAAERVELPDLSASSTSQQSSKSPPRKPGSAEDAPNPSRTPAPTSDLSREGLWYPKAASTVKEDFAGWYANRPNSERSNEFLNRVGAIEHRGRDAASRLMPEAAKADESMVKSVGWKETGRRPARKEMLEQIQDPTTPSFRYYKFTAGIDDAVANKIGRPTWNDPRAKNWVEQVYPELYHDTGAAFESAGGVRRTAEGKIEPFIHDPASTQGPHLDNFLEPWMGDPDNPKMLRYAEDMASIPENAAAGVTAEQVVKDASEIRSNIDRREAFETEQRVPIKPDIWTDPVDGQTHLVNGAALKLLPSKEFGGGLQNWFLKQHMRAAVVEDIGTPSVIEPGVLNYYRDKGGLREGIIGEVESRNPGAGQHAGESADRVLAGLMGNSEHAGYNFSQKLSSDTSTVRAVKEGLKMAAESAISRTWMKSLLQPYFEIPAMMPGGAMSKLVGYGKVAGLQSRYLAASGLRFAEDWLNIPKGRALASKIASTESEQMSAQGVATNFTEALTAGFKGASQDMGVNLYNGPTKGIERALDLAGKAGEKTARGLGVWNIASNKLNNFVAGMHDWTASKLGEGMAKDYVSLARDGKLSGQELQRLERVGANPESIAEITEINTNAQKGVKAATDPVFEAEFGKELARAVPWDTQFRGASPLRKQRFTNDKWLSNLFKFQTFQFGTLRHGEEFISELGSAKTMADRSEALKRLAFRVGGAQLQGEVARGISDMLGRDRTELEDSGAWGRMGMNLIYANAFGPLFMAFDFAAQKAGVDRPWAKRGSHTEQAMGVKDMIFNTQPVETFLQLTTAPAFAAAESMGLVNPKPGHEDDSMLDPYKKALLKQPAVGDATRMLFGNDAVSPSRSSSSSSGATPKNPYAPKPQPGNPYGARPSGANPFAPPRSSANPYAPPRGRNPYQ